MSKTQEGKRLDDLVEDGVISKAERIKVWKRFKSSTRKGLNLPVLEAVEKEPVVLHEV